MFLSICFLCLVCSWNSPWLTWEHSSLHWSYFIFVHCCFHIPFTYRSCFILYSGLTCKWDLKNDVEIFIIYKSKLKVFGKRNNLKVSLLALENCVRKCFSLPFYRPNQIIEVLSCSPSWELSLLYYTLIISLLNLGMGKHILSRFAIKKHFH